MTANGCLAVAAPHQSLRREERRNSSWLQSLGLRPIASEIDFCLYSKGRRAEEDAWQGCADNRDDFGKGSFALESQ
jgi:hypothetical protein